MRAFWAIVLVLLLGGAAAAFFTPQSNKPTAPAINSSGSDSSPESAPPHTPPSTPKPSTDAAPTEPPVDFKLDLENAIGAAAKPPAPSSLPSDAAKPVEGTPVELPTSAAWPMSKMIPAKAVRVRGKEGNETLVIDGKYHVTGSGTKSDPYVVPFELLMSAADVYDPRKGLTKMPQRVAFLHEKHIELDGYIAFPITSTDPRHLLVMFNQWDGCCIGVPPTIYDSIETNLDHAVEGDDKFITFGTTTGVLKVDPYLDNGWLLGLYLLDHAAVSNAKGDAKDQ